MRAVGPVGENSEHSGKTLRSTSDIKETLEIYHRNQDGCDIGEERRGGWRVGGKVSVFCNHWRTIHNIDLK